MTDKTKVCSRCGREQPVENFSYYTRGKDGLQAWDKKCVVEHRRELRRKYRSVAQTNKHG